jgi:hypothetical protein
MEDLKKTEVFDSICRDVVQGKARGGLTTEQWINKQGKDKLAKFRIINPDQKLVLEGWRNLRTKVRFFTKARKATMGEIISANTKTVKEIITP